ncbi:hypothetical protein AB0C11_27830 [Streptomyces sp. NPDC039016]|uniref:hypothetical protein n=1 Tax=Streptomyces sp. NPDC039016 TaxID=3154330 RepID=UPI0033EEB32B
MTALRQAQIAVTWKLTPAEWALVLAAVRRWGTDALVHAAIERTAGRDIRSARYLLAIWRDAANFTPTSPPTGQATGGGGTVVPLRRGSPSYADNLLAGLALLEEREAQ